MQSLTTAIVYTSPTKGAQVVDFKKLSMGNEEIAQRISIHHTIVACILKCFEESADPYYVNPKTGSPCKTDGHKVQVAAQMLAKTEAANATKVMKKTFPAVSCHTLFLYFTLPHLFR